MAAGRPNKYTTNIEPYLDEIKILRKGGIDYSKIAKMLNIAESTLYKHKAEIEQFTESIKKADEELILSVEKGLYNLARGNYVQIKRKTVYEADKKTVKSYEVTEDFGKPDLGASIFVLINMASDKWSNKQDIRLDSSDNIAPSFSEVLKESHESNQ